MAKNFSVLREKMSAVAQREIEGRVEKALAEMPLDELRRARGLSQKALADALRVQQPAIAKMERRADMYISTLRSHIEAMGGVLEITARFPDGAIKISNFSQLE
ncbi:MAG: helix-turn-helix domain-containing protein [Synergistaceae bacterium]|nr:helix-turn-helix domain-containing protein [Synergistaceae bacterium]